MERVELEVKGEVPPPTIMSFDVKVAAPVPPETKSSPEVKPGVKREPLMRNWLSKVEEALTKIPAKDEVGVRASAAKLADCQFEPPAPAAVSSFAQIRLPLASVVRVPLLL